ncbi:voltage-dependent calcium channel beta subunit-associated regulatory protein [Chanos chanos]|uniref:Voltage-dependent calcium channel beta subunit-associated regulatory protein n=1 Tax=Chanos chanos TaxID=29144 RepID=A0A6J2VIU5_CHACN|nr:voltage-dependent calcium channel beta subunit-associated regulatory protein-like [Chanos chanos]
MSNEPPLLRGITENATDVPVAPGKPDNYILLLVLLCLFAGGTIILLSVLLIFCHRCCQRGRRHSRASDDLEKTNTTYVEESQAAQEITIRLEGTDVLSATSCHGETEAEHFPSTAYTGRRVSFNETAIYEQSKKGQEKGRRYTLTEGDFHHLKRARLTHLHIPPPALKILTIMECESPESSINLTEQPASKPSLSIFQPSDGALPESPVSWASQSPSSALPGDTFNSVLDTSFNQSQPESSTELIRSRTLEVMGERAWSGGGLKMDGEQGTCLGGSPGQGQQGSVLQFLSKLRRHTSLEGASPYFKIKKWKFDSSQRAASLDLRGSPRRRAFQRQRAASETLDQVEGEETQLVGDFLWTAPRPQSQSDGPRRLSAGSLSASVGPSPSPSLSPSLSRLKVEAVLEVDHTTEKIPTDISHKLPESSGAQEEEVMEQDVDGELLEGATGGGGAEGGFGRLDSRQENVEHPSLYRDIWSLRASLEQYASSDLSSNDRDSTRSDADSVCSLGGAGASRMGTSCYQSQDLDDEVYGDGELPFEELGKEERNARDSMDSERGSDGEVGSRKLLQMDSGYASIEAPCRAPEELRLFGSASGKTASERRRFFTNAGRKGTVCESFEARLFKEELEDEVSVTEVTAEKESPFSLSHGAPSLSPREIPQPQVHTSPTPKPRSRFRRRDYSIDEKTEALFNEFLRHDPQFDQQGSPSVRPRHRSRIHLRKQWQRTKQYSDPGGARYSPSLERQRFPLRRGDSASYPLDTRYHSTLPRIASAADEEGSEGGASAAETPVVGESGLNAEENSNNSSNNSSPVVKTEADKDRPFPPTSSPTHRSTVDDPETLEDCGPTDTHSRAVDRDTDPCETGHVKYHVHADKGFSSTENIQRQSNTETLGTSYSHHTDTIETSTADKLAVSLDDRLYTSLRRTQGSKECVVAMSRTFPDHTQE